MWYPASHGSWYLSGASGTLSLSTVPFEWDIRADRLGGYRYVFIIVYPFDHLMILVDRIAVPGRTQVVSSVGRVGDEYILATLQSQDANKDSQRWTIE